MYKRFTSVSDVPDVVNCVDEALSLKEAQDELSSLGRGKTLGLIFMNPSLRTRMSTQLAARRLGMDVLVMSVGTESWQIEFMDGAVMNGNTVEHVRDAAAVMGLYCDVVGLRAFPGLKQREEDSKERVMESFLKYCGKPFISLESATRHPLQSLADLMTIKEHSLTERPKVLLCWAPHIKPLPQAVANSFSEWMRAWGQAEFNIACPAAYDLDPIFTKGVQIIRDPKELSDAPDFVYFKNWSSFECYGEMPEDGTAPFKNQSAFVSDNTRIMHCLPVRRNVEVPDNLLDSDRSLILKQAENRICSAQWALKYLLEKE